MLQSCRHIKLITLLAIFIPIVNAYYSLNHFF